jgi:predicted nucleotidyltransferase
MSVRRKTADLDIAVAVATWEIFDALENRLLARGARGNPGVRHEFFVGKWSVDIIPFAGVERNGVIRWPPDGQTELNVAGLDEASAHAFEVILPGNIRVLVASPPGLLILKLIAWKDRHWRFPRRDGVDIRTLLDSYSEAWNQERLYDEARSSTLGSHLQYARRSSWTRCQSFNELECCPASGSQRGGDATPPQKPPALTVILKLCRALEC